jgi:hypothetical protein
MNFLYPEFLWALFTLAIPIIIHLFHFRKFKKVYFSNVRFLKQIKNESESTSKIKNLLILISRLLALTCLVLVFAQPFLPKKENKSKAGNKAVSIFVDNSFSMEAENKNGLLSEQAKNKAREIAKSYSDETKFQLLTHDFEGKHQHLLSKDEFLQAIDELKISSSSKKLSEIYARQNDLLKGSSAPIKQNFIISDFQENTCDFNSIKKDTSLQTYFLPIQSKQQNNVFIDSCWFENPVQQFGISQRLNVKIVNLSDNQLANATLKLFSNNKLIAPVTFSAEPGSHITVPISFLPKESGFQQCRLEIEDAPVTFDNQLYFSFHVKSKIKVVVVNGKNSKSSGYFNSLMKNDSLFEYINVSEEGIAYNEFSTSDFIILNDLKTISSGLISETNSYLQKGGSVLLFPHTEADLTSYNQLFTLLNANMISSKDTGDYKVDKVNFEQGLYEGVFMKKQENIDLPKTFSHYTFSNLIKNNEDVILTLVNGNKFLSKLSLNNNAKFYLCSSSLEPEASNFGKHALFVPTIIKIGINSTSVKPLYFKTNKNEAITLKNLPDANNEVVHIINETNKTDIIPEIRKEVSGIQIFTQSQINTQGNYTIKYNTSALDVISFNYNRMESFLKTLSQDEIEQQTRDNNLLFEIIDSNKQSMQKLIQHELEGTSLWKLFLLLTLLFLLIEILLIRFYK